MNKKNYFMFCFFLNHFFFLFWIINQLMKEFCFVFFSLLLFSHGVAAAATVLTK